MAALPVASASDRVSKVRLRFGNKSVNRRSEADAARYEECLQLPVRLMRVLLNNSSWEDDTRYFKFFRECRGVWLSH